MRGSGPWRGARVTSARRLAVVVALLVLAGCTANEVATSPQVEGGSAQLGAELIASHGCVSCHNVPGIRSEPSWVGPPLERWGQRTWIAGALTNNRENLVRWITDPQSVEEGTAMPDLGVSERDARNIAAYLLSLE